MIPLPAVKFIRAPHLHIPIVSRRKLLHLDMASSHPPTSFSSPPFRRHKETDHFQASPNAKAFEKMNSRSKDEGEDGRMVQTQKWAGIISLVMITNTREMLCYPSPLEIMGFSERCTWVRLSFRFSLHLACFSSSSFDSMKGSEELL
ncbi:LOW QUALITY PROTEIN: hypothetical protein NC653_024475 [Populus alba x Populus x berolinensis]|uniref:Uncharacterized protein n=1 Tax=Populus alba x Populus x berolinensis TaxID=444605 RepID=A0AAD6Q7V6_9ROSI|nr:LOW QUALITY PROTEIN: hypothetical protein NC653_024475 [Populus alba x Populus x berolinensis]